jgi:hypothetical protein
MWHGGKGKGFPAGPVFFPDHLQLSLAFSPEN